MGDMVEFASNGQTARGYLARPSAGAGPGVIVVQEWWGLVPQIKGVCDRFADEGFTALAPDLFHGEIAEHHEPDEAERKMMALDVEQAARDMTGAVDFLAGHDAVRGDGVGVVGFCMGGGLALWLGTLKPEQVKAVVAYYGVIPWEAVQPDWSRLQGSVLGHYGDADDFNPSEAVSSLEETLDGHGIEFEFFRYAGVGHAFANEHNADGYHEDFARQAWIRTLEFLRAKLG
jgi:carboxymethylenebutenolidase